MADQNTQTNTRRWFAPLLRLIASAAAYGFIDLNWDKPTLRFSVPALNYVFLLVSFALPWVALFFAFRIGKRWATITAVVVLLPFLAKTLFLAPFAAIETFDVVHRGVDYSFEPISRVDMGSYDVALYRTNGGATTSFGIAVRQEMSVLPWVRLVRRLEGFYPADAAKYSILGPNLLYVEVPPYGDKAGRRNATYRLTRFVYF